MNYISKLAIALLLFIAMSLQSTIAETVTYVHTDALGSPVAETDASGTVLWRERYSPFGERLDNSSSTNDIGFTGHEFDKDTGLTYMQARYYDPVIGRFYSNDPIGFRDLHSFNRYAYANNNPFKYVDPTGMSNVDIEIQRTSETQNSTSGTISVTSDGSSETFSGHTLEPPKSPNNDTGNGTVRMKEGTYDAFVRGPSKTGNYDKPQLEGNIPGEDGKDHSAIQIHAGNKPTNSEGCILVGTSARTDWVSNSRGAMKGVMGVINDTIKNDSVNGEKTTITVTIKDITNSGG